MSIFKLSNKITLPSKHQVVALSSHTAVTSGLFKYTFIFPFLVLGLVKYY